MYDDEGGNQMFYHNQQPYPGQPYYPQNEERHTAIKEQEFHSASQPQYANHSDFAKNFQENQISQNPYFTQQHQEPQYKQHSYTPQQSEETQYLPNTNQQNQEFVQQPYESQNQQNPYLSEQATYQQPQMYQPYPNFRVSPPAPTLNPIQPQILPPGPATPIPTEPTQEQIQQVVGTQFLSLKKPVLDFVKPWVQYGMNEAKHTSHEHAMTEIAAIMFLVGKGFNPTIAHYIVESWEKNEQF